MLDGVMLVHVDVFVGLIGLHVMAHNIGTPQHAVELGMHGIGSSHNVLYVVLR